MYRRSLPLYPPLRILLPTIFDRDEVDSAKVSSLQEELFNIKNEPYIVTGNLQYLGFSALLYTFF